MKTEQGGKSLMRIRNYVARFGVEILAHPYIPYHDRRKLELILEGVSLKEISKAYGWVLPGRGYANLRQIQYRTAKILDKIYGEKANPIARRIGG